MLDASLALLLGTNNAPSSRSKVRHTHGHGTESPQRVHRGYGWSLKLPSLKKRGNAQSELLDPAMASSMRPVRPCLQYETFFSVAYTSRRSVSLRLVYADGSPCGGRHALGCSWGPVPCGIDPIQCSSAQREDRRAARTHDLRSRGRLRLAPWKRLSAPLSWRLFRCDT